MGIQDDFIREFRELLDNRGYRGTLPGRNTDTQPTPATVAAKTIQLAEKQGMHP